MDCSLVCSAIFTLNASVLGLLGSRTQGPENHLLGEFQTGRTLMGCRLFCCLYPVTHLLQAFWVFKHRAQQITCWENFRMVVC